MTVCRVAARRMSGPLARMGLIFLLAMVLIGCDATQRLDTGSGDPRTCLDAIGTQPLSNGIMVEPDDGLAPIVDEIRAASCTVDVSVYLLSEDVVINELMHAAGRGVRVRVMLEEHPFGGGGGQYDVAETLRNGEIEVRWSGSDIRFSHAKYLVVDRQVALILNQNLTHASFEGNREFGAITTAPDAVVQAQRLFDADWAGTSIDGATGPLVISPTSSRSRYLALIGGAIRSIDFYAEVIRDPQIIDALGAAEQRGVEVRLILNDTLDADDQEAFARLHADGVEVRLANGLYIHAKLMVIDEERIVVGSQNFTATSLDENREVAIVLGDPRLVGRCVGVFGRDWISASPGAPVAESMRRMRIWILLAPAY